MATRFRKSVKILPGVKLNLSKSGVSTSVGVRGASMTFGKNGTYLNTSIRGTGISQRTRIDAPAKNPTQANNSGLGQEMHIEIKPDGTLAFFDSYGAQITDPSLLAAIKKSPEYKAALPEIKLQQRNKAERTLAQYQHDTESMIELYRQSPHVLKRFFYESKLSVLQPARYEPKQYFVLAPTPQIIQQQLSQEADAFVKGAPWKLNKLKEQYVAENYQSRYDEALVNWYHDKLLFEKEEASRAAEINASYQKEYETERLSLQLALAGDADYIERTAGLLLSFWTLPVEIDAQFEYRPDERCLAVDLGLPTIESLPTETAEQLASGNVKIKEKTQKLLRFEYSKCVFGIAIYTASSFFNISPEIETIVASGYTQRRNNDGDLVEDYILSIKFTRDGFYELDYDSINPESFCMSFENRCNMTATKVFKTITPYD